MRFLLAFVTGLFVLLPSAHGCGLCFSFGGNPLALPHPRTIEIAVATRAAIDKGILKTPSRTGMAGAWNSRDQQSGLSTLKAWADSARSPIPRASGESFTLHIVLVDTAQSCTIHARAGHCVLAPRTGGHADASLATTQAAIQAILSGELSWERAVECGLLHIEGNPTYARRLSPGP